MATAPPRPSTLANSYQINETGREDDAVTQLNATGVTATTQATMPKNLTGAVEALLGVGRHAGAVLDGSGVGSVQGISLSASTGPIVCEPGPTTIISGLRLEGSLGNGAIVWVKAGAKALITNCVLSSRVAKTVVLVESGGKLLISGCVFAAMGSMSDKVVHHTVATPASVVATMCFNMTGNTFHDAANVTATHILT